jgi:hypothetical protein
MKHNAGSRRSRNRNGQKRQGGGRNNYESNGPDVKVRGTAQQVLEKYLALARDAASAGDRIRSESYYQYAEHYFRIVNVDGNVPNQGQVRRDGPGYDHNPNFGAEFDQDVDGSGPQPDVPRAGYYAAEDDGDDEEAPQQQQAADSSDNGGTTAAQGEENGGGRIDESVLPAAVPTAPRQRRSRGKSDDGNDTAGEPEAAQA